MSKKIAVLGSGFSALSAASYLAKAGHEVHIYEKNSSAGGRARQLKLEGFTFDMGPSWYWMPDVFERFFNDFGKTTSDYYQLEKLGPAYRVYFGENDYISIADTLEKIKLTFIFKAPNGLIKIRWSFALFKIFISIFFLLDYFITVMYVYSVF